MVGILVHGKNHLILSGARDHHRQTTTAAAGFVASRWLPLIGPFGMPANGSNEQPVTCCHSRGAVNRLILR